MFLYIQGNRGNNMLHCAASNGRLELVEFLLKNVFVDNANCKNNLGETPLHLAAKGNFGLDEKLCLKTSCFYSVRIKTYIYRKTNHAFIVLVRTGNEDVVARILMAGADLNARTEWGDTPIHYAAQFGNYEVLRFLCEKEAEVHKPMQCKSYFNSYKFYGRAS